LKEHLKKSGKSRRRIVETDITVFIEQPCFHDDRYDTKVELFIDRDYRLFAILANVRNDEGLECVSEPKGLPPNLGIFTYIDEYLGHSPSWLTVAEIKKAITIAKKIKYSDKNYTINTLERIKNIMDIYPKSRMVFWFDC
jgi:hypothetical protein